MIKATCCQCKRDGILGHEIEVFYVGRFNGKRTYRDLHNDGVCNVKWHEKFRAWLHGRNEDAKQADT